MHWREHDSNVVLAHLGSHTASLRGDILLLSETLLVQVAMGSVEPWCATGAWGWKVVKREVDYSWRHWM